MRGKIFYITKEHMLQILTGSVEIEKFPSGTSIDNVSWVPEFNAWALILINNQWEDLLASQMLPVYSPPVKSTAKFAQGFQNAVNTVFNIRPNIDESLIPDSVESFSTVVAHCAHCSSICDIDGSLDIFQCPYCQQYSKYLPLSCQSVKAEKP